MAPSNVSKLKEKGITERRSGFVTGLSRRDGTYGIMKGFHGNGAKLISARKGKKGE
jgi:hypothetical protein